MAITREVSEFLVFTYLERLPAFYEWHIIYGKYCGMELIWKFNYINYYTH
jgi:hypothetical protein